MKVLCDGDCPVYHRMLDSIPSPHLFDESSASSPQVQQPNLPRDITQCPANTAARDLFKGNNIRKPLALAGSVVKAGSQPSGYRPGFQTQLHVSITWGCYQPSSIVIPSHGDARWVVVVAVLTHCYLEEFPRTYKTTVGHKL